MTSEVVRAVAGEVEREATRLGVLERFHILDTDPEEAFDDIAVLASQICGTPIAAITLVDSHRQWFKAQVGLAVCETPRSVSFCAHAIKDPRAPFVVPDARLDPRFATNPLVTADPHIVFYAGIPLLTTGGVPLGSLCVLDRVPRALTGEQLGALRSLARQVESQLELRRELGDLALNHAEEALRAPTATVAQKRFSVAFENAPVSMNLVGTDGRFMQVNTAFCELVGRSADELVGSMVDTVIRADEVGGEEVLAGRLLSGEVRSVLRDGQVLTATGGVVHVTATSSVVRDDNGRPLFFLTQLEDVSARRQAEGALALAESAVEAIIAVDATGNITFWNTGAERMFGHRSVDVLGTSASVIAPLRHKGAYQEGVARVVAGDAAHLLGTTVEVVACRADGTELPIELSVTRWEARGRTSFTAIIRDVTERKALVAQLERRANVDGLTQLATAARFDDWLDELARGRTADLGSTGAVIRISLDRFQLVNSSFGRSVGDDVLRIVARRLQNHGSGGRVARTGGDDFAILLGPRTSRTEAVEVAHAVAAVLAGPVAVAQRTLELTASIGIGLVEAHDPRRALREADDALHHARTLGRGRVQVYDEDARRRSLHRLDVEAGLRRALDLGHLVLHYQPQVDLATGTIAGAEALVRWEHPEQGLLSPGLFIDVAEDSGLIVPLGTWVLGTALDQLARWRRAGVVDDDFVLAVNLSARQLTEAPTPDVVSHHLDATGCRPSQLCLEITETALMEDTDVAMRTMDSLVDLGVQLAIDDFGTGYSSLAYLERFPVNQLKIDQSFISRLDGGSNGIPRAIIEMARSLDMQTVAEGIETPAQLTAIRDLGCDQGQGYHLARPTDTVAFTELVAGKPTW